MSQTSDIVITGIGVISPLGIGSAETWQAIVESRSGVGPVTLIDSSGLPVHIAGEVKNFDPTQHIKPRKSIKVMPRDAQLAITVAGLAREDAGLTTTNIEPERIGSIMGADTINPILDDVAPAYRVSIVDGVFDIHRWGTGMFENFPLGMLKLLPNMVPSHISISLDARGPNNTIYNSELSGLQSIGESASILERGHADVMLAGGASSRMQPSDWIQAFQRWELSRRNDEPQRASRPFDAGRDGLVRGEGGAVIVLETRKHAVARGARMLGAVAGWASSCAPVNGKQLQPGRALANAIQWAMRAANIGPDDLSHVSAAAASTRQWDKAEAQVLRALLPDVPVTAPKSFLGNLFAASGAVELAIDRIAAQHGVVPHTLNYEQPDQECPVNVVRGEPVRRRAPYTLLLSTTYAGQAAAVVIGPPE